MYKNEDIINAARAIRPELPGLLKKQAEAVGRELNSLLNNADAGKAVGIDILELLGAYPATREWMRQRLEGGGVTRGGDKAYSPLAGDHKPPADVVYECACGNTEFSPKVLATPPLCPNCGQPMKFKV